MWPSVQCAQAFLIILMQSGGGICLITKVLLPSRDTISRLGLPDDQI